MSDEENPSNINQSTSTSFDDELTLPKATAEKLIKGEFYNISMYIIKYLIFNYQKCCLLIFHVLKKPEIY